jgi:hypothetical protein
MIWALLFVVMLVSLLLQALLHVAHVTWVIHNKMRLCRLLSPVSFGSDGAAVEASMYARYVGQAAA